MGNDFYKAAKATIDDMFNDREATNIERLENLQRLRDEIDTMIDCVESDMEGEDI